MSNVGITSACPFPRPDFWKPNYTLQKLFSNQTKLKNGDRRLKPCGFKKEISNLSNRNQILKDWHEEAAVSTGTVQSILARSGLIRLRFAFEHILIKAVSREQPSKTDSLVSPQRSLKNQSIGCRGTVAHRPAHQWSPDSRSLQPVTLHHHQNCHYWGFKGAQSEADPHHVCNEVLLFIKSLTALWQFHQ